MTYAEIEESYPDVIASRAQDKMGYRYPRGENYYDVIKRLEPYIVDLESNKSPIIVISHNATLKCLYGYFGVLKIESLASITIPLHTVIKITPQTYGYQEERYKFDMDEGSYEKVSINEKDLNVIRKGRQKLSFDMDDPESDEMAKINDISKLSMKIKSFNDLSKMTSGTTKFKSGKLRRVKNRLD